MKFKNRQLCIDILILICCIGLYFVLGCSDDPPTQSPLAINVGDLNVTQYQVDPDGQPWQLDTARFAETAGGQTIYFTGFLLNLWAIIRHFYVPFSQVCSGLSEYLPGHNILDPIWPDKNTG